MIASDDIFYVLWSEKINMPLIVYKYEEDAEFVRDRHNCEGDGGFCVKKAKILEEGE